MDVQQLRPAARARHVSRLDDDDHQWMTVIILSLLQLSDQA